MLLENSQNSKKYQIILADPPWKQKGGTPFGPYKKVNGKQVFNMASTTSLDLPYDTLSIEKIKDIPVANISGKDAVLFIWATNKHLPLVFDIINSWGFKYSTTLVWCKKPFGGGMGGTFRVATEFLIFARKGSLKGNKNIRKTWFDVKRKYVNGYPKHSLKPYFFRDMINDLFDGNKIELFAREKTEGWTSIGYDIDGIDIKESLDKLITQ